MQESFRSTSKVDGEARSGDGYVQISMQFYRMCMECAECHGKHNSEALEIHWRGKHIATF